MAKELFEFYCSGGCQGYFRTKLRTNIDGEYVIICPGCGHKHFRKIRKGCITSDRWDSKWEEKGAQRIVVPKSAFSKEPVMEHPKMGDEGGDSAVKVTSRAREWLFWDAFRMGKPRPARKRWERAGGKK